MSFPGVITFVFINILHLNVRGLCSGNKDSHIWTLVHQFKLHMIDLIETKIKEVDLVK